MSAPGMNANSHKKRPAADASAAPSCKKVKDIGAVPAALSAATASTSAIPGWQYPPLPMGMMPPMPYCFPGSPFFPPFMFPPFWMPAALGAMPGAAAMAAMASAATANPAAAGMLQQCAMQQMMPAAMMAGLVSCGAAYMPSAPDVASATRTASGVSAAVQPASVSCTSSMPTLGTTPSPVPTPPPLASSPSSVCDGGLERPPEDDEFASFIDSFLNCGDGDMSGASFAKPAPTGRVSCDSSSNSSEDTEEALCLPRSDSLLNLLDGDIEFQSLAA